MGCFQYHYRHHTGDWAAARRTFGAILAMPADPISRAVALHGIGKMTIHDGDFAIRYDACFPIRSKEWTKVTLAWGDFVPVLPGPKSKPTSSSKFTERNLAPCPATARPATAVNRSIATARTRPPL